MSSTKFWVCTKRDCNARITTCIQTNEILHGLVEHTHDADSRKTQELAFRQSCKRKATEDLTQRPRKITIQEAKKADINELSEENVSKIRRAMWRERRKEMPLLPKTRQETLVAVSSIQTKQPTNVLAADNEKGIIYLYSTDVIKYIKDADHLYGDGTFKICPRNFYQLYTIIALRNGFYIPVIFFLFCQESQQRCMWTCFHILSLFSKR